MNYWFKPLSDESEWKWISDRANCSYCDDSKGIIAYLDSDIVGAVALDSWSYNSVCIHIAVEDIKIFRHKFAEEVFSYIFQTCDKGVVIGITPADNEAALRFNAHIGLTELYRIQDGFKVGVDYVVQQLRKENCRYISHEISAKSIAA